MLLADMFDGLAMTLLVTFIAGGWVIVAVANTIVKNWRMARESEHQAALKQTMIDKGMSVEDIERVVRVSPTPPEPPPPQPAQAEDSAAVDVATKLAEHEVPAPAVEEILRAFQASDPQTRQTLAKVVESMLDNGADADRVLAAVRALAHPSQPQRSVPGDHRFVDEPASFRN
jgi:hypothetical protein